MHDNSMHNVPFVLLPLKTMRSTTTNAPSTLLPGVVVEEEHTASALWCSRDFPAEIGVQVLCCSHYHAHLLKIAFAATKRPSKMEVFVAYHTENSRPCVDNELTRYFAASFHPACAPIFWAPETALSWPLRSTQLTISLPHDALRRCQFIRLVIHRNHPHPDNTRDEVAIKRIGLRGELSIPEEQQDVIPPPLLQKSSPVPGEEGYSDEVEDIRQFLTTAGLPNAMIESLLASPLSRLGSQVKLLGSTLTEALPSDSNHEQAQSKTEESERHILDSVFDAVIRDFITQRHQQDVFFASLTPSREHQSPPLSSLALARIAVDDRHRAFAIATYTFGAFYTQCLQYALDTSNEDETDDDLVIQCLQVAERLAIILLRAGLAKELIFEGLLSLVRLTLTSRCSLTTFDQTLRLVRSIFLENTQLDFLKLHPVMVQSGLETVIDLVLRMNHCWISVKAIDHTHIRTLTINRLLHATVRQLLTQLTTRSLFLHVIIPNSEHQAHQVQEQHDIDQREANRLRFLRWILQTERDTLVVATLERMRSFCHIQVLNGGNLLKDLASQCIMMLDYTVQGLAKHTLTVRQRLKEKQREEVHSPLYEMFPLSEKQSAILVSRTRQYFELHKRPSALYQHMFTMADTAYASKTKVDGFQKGNIVFKGQVEVREWPTSVRGSMRNRTDVRLFEKPTGDPTAGVVGLETLFARFRGTIESRDLNAKSVTETPVNKSTKEAERPSRRPSLTKSSRVVPVDLPTRPSVDAQLPKAQPSDGHIVAVPQPAVTASPLVSPQRPGSALAQASASPTSPTPPAEQGGKPRTAPPSKNHGSNRASSSQDGGCVVQ